MDDNAFGIAKAEMRLTIPETAVLEVCYFFLHPIVLEATVTKV
jgi:hypothetical protein